MTKAMKYTVLGIIGVVVGVIWRSYSPCLSTPNGVELLLWVSGVTAVYGLLLLNKQECHHLASARRQRDDEERESLLADSRASVLGILNEK